MLKTSSFDDPFRPWRGGESELVGLMGPNRIEQRHRSVFTSASRLQRLISAPISHFARTARTVLVGRDYTIRGVKEGRDEMGTLIDDSNETLAQIQHCDIELQRVQDGLEKRVAQRTQELQDEVAERKRAENALRRSEEHFRSLIENASDIITIVDLDGTIRYESPSVERVLGYQPEELLGRNVTEFAHPEDPPATMLLRRSAEQVGNVATSVELRFRHRSGEWRILEVVGRVVSDESGPPRAIINSRDITERKLSESALAESEEKYRTILESIQEGYYEVDLNGNLTFFNDSLSRIVGTPPEKLKGLNHRAYTNRVTAERIRNAFLEVLRTGSPLEELQCEINTLEGLTRCLEISVSLRRDSTGEVCGYRGTIRDITDRKQAEQSLRESEERYKTLFETASDAIMVMKADDDVGRIVAANRAAEEMTGYTSDELLTLNIGDLITQESAGETASRFALMLAGERLNFEVEQRRKDGSNISVEVNSSLLNVGDTRYILGFARDISRRKQAEKEVTMLAHAVRSIQECVAITDSDDTLLFVNDAFLTTYGYERAEILGRNILELVRPAVHDPDSGKRIPPSKVPARWEGELINRRRGGAEFPILLSTSPIVDDKGRTIAYGAVSQDITEQKRAIADLQNAKDAAEAANRAKGEFLANMSHEIRTPMNGIIGMTELALDTDLTDEQREYVRLVKLSANSLLGVINDILDFSKIEAGKLRLDVNEFDLHDAIDEVTKALGVRADQKGIELAYYLRPGVPSVVVGDLGRLRQVLVNLLGNAIKFTEEGEVIVRVETQAQEDHEAVLHFSVRDTGIGVPIEKQTMIFDSFTQADGSTTRKYGGTGLGLSISKQLVDMMGGRMWVESPAAMSANQASPGSIFHFTARFGLRAASAPAGCFEPQPSDLQGRAVLVVDDNATNRRILEVQLSNWGMNPVAVATGSGALEAIEQASASEAPLELTLLDFHLTDIDGLDLAERIRQMPEAAGIKIIMMSSSLHPGLKSRASELGIGAQLVKPVKPSDLLSAMTSALGKAGRSDVKTYCVSLKSSTPSCVLVAEDSPVNQTLMNRLLKKWGHTPVIARTGVEALSLLEGGRFAAVLMDLQMPEMNGFEATARIRDAERNHGTHMPIIALTAHTRSGDRERCLAAGMDDYVGKPIDANQLFDALENALRRRPDQTNGGSDA